MICIFFVSFFCACSGLFPNNKQYVDNNLAIMDTDYRQQHYDSTILIIEKKALNIISWDELFGFKEFVNLYEHGVFYVDSAIKFLGNKVFTDFQKKISINSMQRVKLEDYVRVCKECKMLFDEDKISESILEWAISPNFSDRKVIVRNYDKEVVIKFLHSIKRDSKISTELKKNVDNILSGESWYKLKEMNGDST